MADNQTTVQINRTARGFDNLSVSAGRATKSLKEAVIGNRSLARGLADTTGELVTLKGAVAGVLGMFTVGAWESGFEIMGRLQESSNQIARTWGEIEKSSLFTKEMVGLANSLGISYENAGAAMASATKHRAQIMMTNEEFIKATKNASAFGEATGMGAEQGAAMMGKFVGIAKLTPKQIGMIQNEFIALQQTIGMTGEEMAQLAEGITPVIDQVKLLGATSKDIEGLVTSTSELTLKFSAMGKSASDSTQFIDRMLDPGRLSENIVLYSQLGLSMSDAMNAMQGEDPGGFLDSISDRLPQLGERIMAMGPMAGDMFAKQLGLSYREAIQFTKMGSKEAQAQMKKLEEKRKKEERFQEQLNQTLRTWQRTLIGITQAFDQIRMRFSQVLGGDNFVNFKKQLINLANTILDILSDARIHEIIGFTLKVIEGTIKAFRNLFLPLAGAIGNAVKETNLTGFAENINKITTTVGAFLGDFAGKYGPKLLAIVTGFVNGTTKLMEAIGPGKSLFAAVAGFAGFSFLKGGLAGEGLGGAFLGPILSKISGGIFGAKMGTKSNPMYVQDIDKKNGPGGLFDDVPFLNDIIDFFKKKKGPKASSPRTGVGSWDAMQKVLDKNKGGRLSKFGSKLTNMPVVGDALGKVGTMAKGAGSKVMGIPGIGSGLKKLGGKAAGLTARIAGMGTKTIPIVGQVIMAGMAIYDGIKGAMDESFLDKTFKKKNKDLEITAKHRFGAGVASAIDGLLLGLMPEGVKEKVAKFYANMAGEFNPAEFVATGGVSTIKNAFISLVKSSEAYEEALYGNNYELLRSQGLLQNTNKKQYAFQEGLFKGRIVFGTSINDIADGIDSFLLKIEKLWLGLQAWWNNTLEKLSNTVFNPEWWLGLQAWWNNTLEKLSNTVFSSEWWSKKLGMISIANMFKNLVESAKVRFYSLTQGITMSMSDGMNRIIYRILKVLPGANYKGFAESAQKALQTKYNQQVAELLAMSRRAQASGDQSQIDAFNEALKDSEERVKKHNQFVLADKERRADGWRTMTQASLAKLDDIKENTRIGAGAGVQAAKELEQIKRNTTPPKKFIDLDALAIRANESRDVYMTYQTVPTGQ